MLICHCRTLTDQAIRAHIEAGASCERDLTRGCGAGGRCGACLPAVRRLLAQHAVFLRQPLIDSQNQRIAVSTG